MKSLTPSERRTLRLGSIGLSLYLLAFVGLKWFQAVDSVRRDHARLRERATALRSDVDRYQLRTERLTRLMDRLQIDPGTLRTNTVVGEASAALQRVAQSQGLQVSSVRESVNRSGERELGSIQFDAGGPTQAVLGFLARIQSLGVPVLVDSVQCTANPRGPGQLKLLLNVVVLDFDQWKPREVPRA
jgi:hypothetical protein